MHATDTHTCSMIETRKKTMSAAMKPFHRLPTEKIPPSCDGGAVGCGVWDEGAGEGEGWGEG